MTCVRRPLTFFVPLNDYKPARHTAPLPLPQDWLAAQWADPLARPPCPGDLLRQNSA